MATAAQIDANRRNATKSTGPKTDEGKLASRRNALKHGLAGAGVVLTEPMEQEVARRLADWGPELDPHGSADRWAVESLVRESVRIDACHREESALRAREARRAALCWDEDRRRDAAELGRTLPRRPGLIRRRLRSTAQGCAWLLAAWAELLATRESGPWSAAQRARALDLLGIDPLVRVGRLPIDPAAGGDPVASARVAAEAEVADLRRLKAEAMDRLDAADRDDAVRGVAPASPDLRRLRRYHSGSFRRFQWAWDRLKPQRRTPARAAASPAMPAPPAPRPVAPPAAPTPPAPAESRLPLPPLPALDLFPETRSSFVPISVGRATAPRPAPPARRS